jgi:hypothetical protein
VSRCANEAPKPVSSNWSLEPNLTTRLLIRYPQQSPGGKNLESALPRPENRLRRLQPCIESEAL